MEISLAFGGSNMEFPLRLFRDSMLDSPNANEISSRFRKKKKASVDKRGAVWEIVWKGWYIHK